MARVSDLVTLTRKNFLLKRKRPCGSCFELLVPLVLIALFSCIKNLSEVKVYPRGWAPKPGDSESEPTSVPYSSVSHSINLNSLPGDWEVNDAIYLAVKDAASQETVAFRDAFKEWVESKIKNKRNRVRVYGDGTASALSGYIESSFYLNGSWPTVYAAVIFNDVQVSTAVYDYTLRLNSSTGAAAVPSTSYFSPVENYRQGIDYSFTKQYAQSGFCTLQTLVDSFTISKHDATFGGISEINALPFPYIKYKQDEFYAAAKMMLPLVFILSFLYPTSCALSVLVNDKESSLREMMRMMGVSDFSIIGSWYITYGVYWLVVSAAAAFASRNLFPNSDGAIIFLLFFTFGLSTFALCFCLTSVFWRARTAAIIGPIIYFMFFFLFYLVNKPEIEKPTIVLIFPQVSFALIIHSLSVLEENGKGLLFNTLGDSINNFTPGVGMFMLFFDFWLFSLLGIYLDRVLPQQYGSSLPFYFPLSPKFWFPSSSNMQTCEEMKSKITRPSIEPVTDRSLLQAAEKGDCIKIRSLKKIFTGPQGTKVAVDNFSLDIYEGQILALLGHNGAGKTTLLNMLSGMLEPTEGTAMIGGLDIRQDMSAVRQSMGFCPQHSALYDDLTVTEHVEFYGRLKGIRGRRLEKERNRIIYEVGLTKHRYVQSSKLSGGLKRKLSVCIALLGNSRVVFLDEPTSGMDPYSRRSTWELLQKNRRGRIMILTTHYMDEADILGDRIAIMAEGKLRTCGSSLFLKNRYGAGYILTLTKGEGEAEHKKSREVFSLIKTHVKDARKLTDVGAELSIQLPQRQSGSFSALFRSLDLRLDSLGIVEYGISVTTLEEVFLRVAERGGADKVREDKNAAKRVAVKRLSFSDGVAKIVEGDEYYISIPNDEVTRVAITGNGSSTLEQFKALMVKRFHYSKRDWKTILCNTLLPIVLFGSGLGILKFGPMGSNDPPYAISTNAFNPEGYDPSLYVPFASPAGDRFENVLTSTKLYKTFKVNMEAIPKSLYKNAYANDADKGVLAVAEEVLPDDASKRPNWHDGTTVYGGVVIEADRLDPKSVKYTIMVNSTATHGLPTYANLVNEALLKSRPGVPKSASIKVTSAPLPQTVKSQQLFQLIFAFLASIFAVIAYAFFPATVIGFIVLEKEEVHNCKHQQLVSGVSVLAYWLSNFVFDSLSFILPLLSGTILVCVFDVQQFLKDALLPLIGVLIGYGMSSIALSYAISFLFKKHSSAQNFILFFNFMTGLVLMVASFVMEQLEHTKQKNSKLIWLYRIFPSFCLGDALLRLSSIVHNDEVALYGPDLAQNKHTVVHPVDMFITGNDMCCLFSTMLIFMLFVIAKDMGFFSSLWPSEWIFSKFDEDADEQEDDCVRKERERVLAGCDDAIRVEELKKAYGTKIAVQGVTFGVDKGECFGYLGVNGAGKTTTLKCLTGDIMPTLGTGYIMDIDVRKNINAARRHVGYCPQFDALHGLLTVKEHLQLYGRIKGLTGTQLETVVEQKITQLSLRSFANKLAKNLSGGNKRKLNVAIAMIGEPSVMMLDEPTTGIDPLSRRFMWDVISSMRNTAVLLTTHSMEECEALCNRITIMTEGRLRCHGTAQQLKSKYGHGYTIDVKLVASGGTDSINGRIKTLVAFFQNLFPGGAKVLEKRDTHVSVQGAFEPAEGGAKIALADVFDAIEQAKEVYGIAEYSVAQTSLEQIFNQFASGS